MDQQQRQPGEQQLQHPPERKENLGRRRTGFGGLFSSRQSHYDGRREVVDGASGRTQSTTPGAGFTTKPFHGPDTFSSYDLSLEALQNFLENKWPGQRIRVTEVRK